MEGRPGPISHTLTATVGGPIKLNIRKEKKNAANGIKRNGKNST